MNLRRLMFKLQTALIHQGKLVKINQSQSYFKDIGRMVTKYVLKVPNEDGGKDVTILETYKAAEVVQTLADMLNGECDDP